jgi:hypothetical protein
MNHHNEASEVLTGFVHIRKNLKKTDGLEVPGCELFKAKDYFHKGPTPQSPIAIRYIGAMFQEQVLPLVEAKIPPAQLFIRSIQKDTPVHEVRDILGKERQSFVYDLAQVLAKQPQGEEGFLDVTGLGNFFFVRGYTFQYIMVNTFWRDGWMLHAYRDEGDMKRGYRMGFREAVVL